MRINTVKDLKEYDLVKLRNGAHGIILRGTLDELKVYRLTNTLRFSKVKPLDLKGYTEDFKRPCWGTLDIIGVARPNKGFVKRITNYAYEEYTPVGGRVKCVIGDQILWLSEESVKELQKLSIGEEYR